MGGAADGKAVMIRLALGGTNSRNDDVFDINANHPFSPSQGFGRPAAPAPASAGRPFRRETRPAGQRGLFPAPGGGGPEPAAARPRVAPPLRPDLRPADRRHGVRRRALDPAAGGGGAARV